VQITIRFGFPLSVTVATWVLGRQVRLVCRLEWLTLRPKVTPLPQI
jgi:hypothetical protein